MNCRTGSQFSAVPFAVLLVYGGRVGATELLAYVLGERGMREEQRESQKVWMVHNSGAVAEAHGEFYRSVT